jgi:hypothetical protein
LAKKKGRWKNQARRFTSKSEITNCSSIKLTLITLDYRRIKQGLWAIKSKSPETARVGGDTWQANGKREEKLDEYGPTIWFNYYKQ